MVTITLYTRQQKRHWCIEQSYGLCGRGRGWEDLGEWHWNTYNIIYETSRQSWFGARYWMLGAGALGWPRGMVGGGKREEGSGWGTHVYLWWIHFDIWQNQYNIVKFKKKSLIRFHSANKINNYNREGGRKKIQKILQNKSKYKNKLTIIIIFIYYKRIINVFLESKNKTKQNKCKGRVWYQQLYI